MSFMLLVYGGNGKEKTRDWEDKLENGCTY
jgi:hypothetical protein